jgi:2Fe-2S ferredoxin
MTKIIFIAHDGTRRTIDVANGLSVLEGGLRHRVPGIDGDCGGACACATCHVYVDPDWIERLAPPSALEQAMLKMAVDPGPTSRLCCQIKVSQALEGLVLTTPKSQY